MAESAMQKKYGDMNNRKAAEDKYARLVARAWTDEDFTKRLVAKPAKRSRSLTWV